MTVDRCRRLVTAAFVLGLAALAPGLASPASAQGVPTLRGHDHTGLTVPSMKEGLDFFVGVMGCKQAMEFGPFSDDKGTFMKDTVNVNPRAVIKQIAMVRCGTGSNIELFEYTSPDQQVVMPKNSDIGGYHIAFYVDNIQKAADYLKSKGVKTFNGPLKATTSCASSRTGMK